MNEMNTDTITNTETEEVLDTPHAILYGTTIKPGAVSRHIYTHIRAGLGKRVYVRALVTEAKDAEGALSKSKPLPGEIVLGALALPEERNV